MSWKARRVAQALPVVRLALASEPRSAICAGIGLASLLRQSRPPVLKLGAPPKTPANSSVPPSKGQKANRPEAGARRKPRK
jgi:hypothetical protein